MCACVRVSDLGLTVGREYLGATLDGGVVILEVLLDLLHLQGAAAGGGVEGLTWTEVDADIRAT